MTLPALAETFLVEDGQPKAEIVIAAEPARAAEFGASELQTYLEKITGTRLEIVASPTDAPIKVYVGESEAARQAGVTAEGLERDAFRMVSGENWLALVGNDLEFEPREPWARNHGQWAAEKQAEWEKLAGKPWMNPVGRGLYRDYNKQLDLWNLDHRGSLNAVYAFLREFGVRWYMPGPLGEVLPETRDIILPELDRSVTPDWKIRSISRPLISANELEPALWYLRIGANEQYGILHHGLRHLTEHPDQRAAHPEYFAMMANGERDTVSKTANACLSSEGFFEEAAALRQEWLAKTSNPLSVTLNYTPFTNRGAYRPQYWPHVIDRGMKASVGETWREDVWISSGKGGLHYPGMAHLNPWVISQLWRDVDQDVDVLLNEYYENFYGPAAMEMKAFIEFCEKEYPRLGTDGEIAQRSLDLFDEAKAAAPADSVFARRIALVDEFLPTFRNRAQQMSVPRPEGLPEYRLIDMGKDKWRDVQESLTLDGKLDEGFWTAYPYPRPLRDAHTGKKSKAETRFMGRWWRDSLVFGIRCEFEKGEPPVIGTEKDGDPAIWQGEHLELLLETDKHSYYQIVVNPAGAIIDLDRGVSMKQGRAYEWSSQAEVAAHVGEDF